MATCLIHTVIVFNTHSDSGVRYASTLDEQYIQLLLRAWDNPCSRGDALHVEDSCIRCMRHAYMDRVSKSAERIQALGVHRNELVSAVQAMSSVLTIFVCITLNQPQPCRQALTVRVL